MINIFLSEKMINGFINHKKRHEQKGTSFKWQPKTKEDIANCLRAKTPDCPTDNTIIVTNNKRVNQNYNKHKNTIEKGDFMDSYNQTIHKDITPTITSRITGSNNYHIYEEKHIRRLTPRECFRLMDFPETFKWSVSDTQAYKQAGNSIVVNVLAEIIKKLKL